MVVREAARHQKMPYPVGSRVCNGLVLLSVLIFLGGKKITGSSICDVNLIHDRRLRPSHGLADNT